MSLETPVLQLLAYTSLTAASVTVAFASTFMVWRQTEVGGRLFW